MSREWSAAPGAASVGAPEDLAADIVGSLTRVRATVAVAESLTGGAVIAALVGVPGASVCVRGGVVAYATDLKAELLGVPQELLEVHGPVHPDVARAMATGVRTRLSADYGLATTGVAGPDPQGEPPGTFHCAVAGPMSTVVRSYDVGALGRDAVRDAARSAALGLLLEVLVVPAGTPGTPTTLE
jgi:nicotinamide-nucleotide amidase